MSQPGSPREELAKALRTRRAQLGLSQRGVTAAGGPVTRTVVNLERTDRPGNRPGPKTLGKVDLAMQWPFGTSRDLYEGELIADEVKNLPVLQRPTESGEQFDLEANLDIRHWAAEHADAFVSFARLVAELNEPPASSTVSWAKALASDVEQWHAMLVLEDHGGPDKIVPSKLLDRHRAVLDAAPPEEGTPDYDRWVYRRWLAHIPVSDEEYKRCHALWQRRTYRPH